jgi:hypothetical protein
MRNPTSVIMGVHEGYARCPFRLPLLLVLLLWGCTADPTFSWGNAFENVIAVAGYVETEQGVRMNGVTVTLHDQGGRAAGAVVTGPTAARPDMADGRFWVDLPVAGAYTVRVAPPPGYVLSSGQLHPVPVEVRRGNLPPDIWIRLRRE